MVIDPQPVKARYRTRKGGDLRGFRGQGSGFREGAAAKGFQFSVFRFRLVTQPETGNRKPKTENFVLAYSLNPDTLNPDTLS
jgi:hypothetical protein